MCGLPSASWAGPPSFACCCFDNGGNRPFIDGGTRLLRKSLWMRTLASAFGVTGVGWMLVSPVLDHFPPPFSMGYTVV